MKSAGMKRLIPGALATLFLAVPALPADFSALQPSGYVNDFAGVISAGARQQIEQYSARVEKATGAQMAFVTLSSLEGEPAEDVANLLFRKWGIGKKGEDTGVLLLLVVRDKRSRLEVGYGLEPILPDGFAGGLLREMRPALREGAYSDAISLAAQRIGSHIAQAKGVTIEESARPRPQRHREESPPWFLILGGLFMLLWLIRSGGGGGGGWLAAMILGNMVGRSSFGQRSGGGFGGYDSGDRFGGFGGGDSGGGGASSDW